MKAQNLIGLFTFLLVVSCSNPVKYDLIFQGGTLIDGTGKEGSITDVGIIDDQIVKIGNLSGSEAQEIINIKGQVICPGFIDLHAHLDPIFRLNDCESHLRQGITTALGGPDGGGLFPFGATLDSLSTLGVGMNVGYLCGHNSIRSEVMELENRDPSSSELEAMANLVNQAMDEGAFGISTGLKYLPGTFSKIEEVIHLSKMAAEKGGIYTSHLRDEGLMLLDGVREAIQIGDQAKIPIVLTHHKVVGKPMWGKSVESLRLVDSARQVGIDVMIDQYPYAASYTGIGILIPSWARAGGNGAFVERVRNPILKDSIHRQIMDNLINDRGGNDLDRVQFAMVTWDTTLQGKTLKHWCEREGLEPSISNGAEMVMRAQLNGGCTCIFHAMNEEDVKRILQHPYTAIATDGRLTALGERFVHPRNYGTFPKVLGKYVREEGILSLEEAIRKMTTLPADRLGLSGRGRLQEGMKADIVVFDPEIIHEQGDFVKPHAYPIGLNYVLVNGKMAVNNGSFNRILSGQVLRKGSIK